MTTTDRWDARIEPDGIWICIPAVPPSLNVWSRQHWRVRNRHVREMTEALSTLRMARRIPMTERPQVQLVYYFRDKRKRDPDNFSGKFLLDGLRRSGIISDDNAVVLRLPQPRFDVDRRAPRTEVWITSWSGGEQRCKTTSC